MDKPIVSINIVVLNGEKYIEHCLNSVLNQSFPHEQIQINILDNGSTDNTRVLIQDFEFKISNYNFPKVNFIMSDFNFGMWGGQEELLKTSSGKYIVVLSTDVIMAQDFIANAVETMEANPKLGALQGKIYQFSLSDLESRDHNLETNKIIDTCGFDISRSRRVGNIGHGEIDTDQFNKPQDIFGVEGAVPIIRTEALRSISVLGEIADHDLFWYAEDLDIAWRLRLAGWQQKYVPTVVAWHDRQTTKKTSGNWQDFISIRRKIPLRKRRLEWRNVRCTIIKNDYIINILKDLPYVLAREAKMVLYLLIFETAVLAELPTLLKLVPKMLRKRKEIMAKAKISPQEIHSYFL